MRYIQLIAVLSFILLISVLFYFTYNTFELNDRQYQTAEKNLLEAYYRGIIKNDHIYPGGRKIMDGHLFEKQEELVKNYRKFSSPDNPYADSLMKGLFSALKAGNPMDSVFRDIKKKYQLSNQLEYLITVNQIKLSYHDRPVFLFDQKKHYAFLNNKSQTEYGYILGGKLTNPLKQNIISGITVSSSGGEYAFDLAFTLYVDKNNRNYQIFKATMPAFLLALLASLSVLFIYYITFKNWSKAKRLAEMKADFVDGITHEFHTPISTIMVANKSLQDERVLSDRSRVKMLTNVILRQSRRLEHLFGQVLDIARLENISLEKEQVVLDDLLEEVVSDYHLKITEDNIRVSLTKATGGITVSLNRFWFTTMLFNIFDNAIKYNNKEIKVINVDALLYKGNVLLRIADNGVGMEEEMVKHIFDKFYRAHASQLTHIPGLGLGLYYAQQCVRAHGWKMEVISKVNAGSEFSIFIS